MEVDTKSEVNEHEALLLGDGGDEIEHTEFSSGDVELLLGDDDVNAFASESFDSTSKDQTQLVICQHYHSSFKSKKYHQRWR